MLALRGSGTKCHHQIANCKSDRFLLNIDFEFASLPLPLNTIKWLQIFFASLWTSAWWQWKQFVYHDYFLIWQLFPRPICAKKTIAWKPYLGTRCTLIKHIHCELLAIFFSLACQTWWNMWRLSKLWGLTKGFKMDIIGKVVYIVKNCQHYAITF